MATQNATVTSEYSLIAKNSDSVVLIQPAGSAEFQVAAWLTNETPTVIGHKIKTDAQGISRDRIGSGYLFARCTSQETGVLVVSGSSETLA